MLDKQSSGLMFYYKEPNQAKLRKCFVTIVNFSLLQGCKEGGKMHGSANALDANIPTFYTTLYFWGILTHLQPRSRKPNVILSPFGFI